MFNKKTRIFVGLTTFDLAALNVSVPWLGKLGRKFTLVIHNDNPKEKLSRRTIRKLGWHGPLHIINSPETVGEWESRLNILEFIAQKNFDPQWITFLDDGDILLDADIPNVSDDKFAVIQNATVLRNNFADFFRINRDWVKGTDYGTTGAHFDLRGTWVRANVLVEYGRFVRELLPQIYKITKDAKYRLPVGDILWLGLNIFVREKYPFMSAIYMNKTNYIVIHFGRYLSKYKQRIVPETAKKALLKKVFEQFTRLFQFNINQNIVASDS